jgi:endoglucanase
MARSIVLRQPDPGWPHQFLGGNRSSTVPGYFISYLLDTVQPKDAQLVQDMKDEVILYAGPANYHQPDAATQPYPQGCQKFYSWGCLTAQGRIADVWIWAWLFETDPVQRQYFLDNISVLSDYSLGLNPLGQSFITGLGTHQPVSTTSLDSWFTKYGQSDGVTDTHLYRPKGQVPGQVLQGAVDGRSGSPWFRQVTDKMFPVYENLPKLRRWPDGWLSVQHNEPVTWDTNVWQMVHFGFLYNASAHQDPGPAWCNGDIDGDGTVGSSDLSYVLGHLWETCE